MPNFSKPPVLLVVGGLVCLLVVTRFWVVYHVRLGWGGLRLLTTFVPVLVGWGLIGAHVGVFDPARVTDPRQLWRPFWAMVLAGPFVGWLRGVFLASGVAPLFVVILGGVSALALLAWRTLYVFIGKK